MSERIPGFSTLAVHAGAQPDPTTGARATPIYQTTSYVFESVDHAASLFGLQTFGNIYTRIGNPTTAVLEERVAALEGGTAGLAAASGHAAQVLIFHCLMQPGDEFVASKKLYGGSINQFNHAFKNFGWNVVWADPDDIGSFERAISPKTKAIFTELIANPGGVITDMAAVSQIAKRAGVPYIVDNTLATPYLCKPFEHGADIVVHSLTKFLGGHGNSIGGMIVDGGTFNWSRERRYPMLCEPRPEYHGIVLHETFGNFAFAIACRVLALRDIGPAISPFNSFLILTGIETLPLRMQKHCDNALAVARMARRRIRKVAWVSYPGLPGDRYHNLAQEILPERRRRGVHLRAQGRLRRRREARVERETVLAPRQYRRHPLADHSSRPRPRIASLATRRRSRPAPAPTWCGCRSASRTKTTSSPTWSRRWRDSRLRACRRGDNARDALGDRCRMHRRHRQHHHRHGLVHQRERYRHHHKSVKMPSAACSVTAAASTMAPATTGPVLTVRAALKAWMSATIKIV